MGFCSRSGVSSLSQPLGVFSSAGRSVIPASQRRLTMPCLLSHTLRPLRARVERNSLSSSNMKNDLGGASLLWRQDERSLRVASYKTSNLSQPETVPVWLWLVKSLFSGVKSSFQFLCEQPGQLKHIEWPTINTVVTMAMLTLIVVTCLIVLLATVDSTMSYVLASLLRRVP